MTWPRIETAESMTTLVSGKPLEWSARQAYRELLEWVVEDYDDRPRRRRRCCSAMVAQAGICQISNTDYTAYCVAPRDVLASRYRALDASARGRARRPSITWSTTPSRTASSRRAGSRSRRRGSGSTLQAIAHRGPLAPAPETST